MFAFQCLGKEDDFSSPTSAKNSRLTCRRSRPLWPAFASHSQTARASRGARARRKTRRVCTEGVSTAPRWSSMRWRRSLQVNCGPRRRVGVRRPQVLRRTVCGRRGRPAPLISLIQSTATRCGKDQCTRVAQNQKLTLRIKSSMTLRREIRRRREISATQGRGAAADKEENDKSNRFTPRARQKN